MTMKIFSWRSISLQIVLAVLLPLTAGAIFISFYSQNLHHTAMQSLVGERDLRTVESLAGTIDEIIQSRLMMMDAIAGTSTKDAFLSKPQPETGILLQDFPAGVLEVDSSGRIIDQTLTSKLTASDIQNITQELPGFGQIEPMIISKTGNVAGTFTVIAKHLPGGSILLGVVDLQSELTGVVSSMIKPGILSVQVYDNTHTLIFEAGRLPLDTHTVYHSGVLAGLEGKSGVIYPDAGHAHGQGAHVIAYAPIKTTNWVLVLDEAWEDVSSAQLTSTQSAPLILIPFFLLAVIALLIIIRQVVIPLQKLEQQTQALGKGDFSAIGQSVGGISEIRSLQTRMGEMADNLRKARESLQYYIGSITRGVEEERLRLSRDLHDEAIQSLIALKYRLQTAKVVDITENPKLVQKVIEELRRLVRGLRPVILEDLGLVAALENLCQQMEQEDRIPTILRVTGSESRFSRDVELAFYRIAQEGLMNIQKHSSATRVEINLEYRQNSLAMELIDYGKGFVIPERFDAIVADGHFGLIGMMERAGLINADIEFKSKPGEGTTIKVHYPGDK